MEMTKNNAFVGLSDSEMMQVDGGISMVVGMCIGFAVDGIVIAATGKSCGEWVAVGVRAGVEKIRSW